ncbi:sugar transferase [Loktanella sp. M215]|uniref:sugar transferase n=1 Tax=Loktanella sp. M215 TaxID=2675431 RepID=UPI001F26374B|nr:sugar transferase [Loktanella sp. M215]MCF7702171.1 sugar transferase [Loktanella sp. M215]
MVTTSDVIDDRHVVAQNDTGLQGINTKRIFDILFALTLLPVIAPIIVVIWALVRHEGGPGFFGHVRIGSNGRASKCWKIRTMLPDAQSHLQAHLAQNPEATDEWATDHKLTDDPRITRLRRLLRRTSLDELPQIWNVLRGDMSFVGPCPIVRSELHKYAMHRGGYLRMKPGITGLWQVSGRNDISYDDRVAMDMSYAKAQTFWLDLRIIALTLGTVLNRTGK